MSYKKISILRCSLVFILNMMVAWGGLNAAPSSPYDEKATDLAPVVNVIIKKNTAEGLEYYLDVTLPKVAGSYPVFLFMTGLNGVAPSLAYRKMAAKLAARGVATVIPIVGFTRPDRFVETGRSFVRVATWMKQNLNDTISKQGEEFRGITVDSAKLVVSGHSSGAKAIISMYRDMHAEIAGVVLLDPVDSDPSNLSKSSIEEDEVFHWGTPLLVLGSGLGNQPGVNLGRLWPPCAPVGHSSDFFYSHFESPKWFIKSIDYGHADMLEGVFLWGLQVSHFCKSSADKKDPDMLRTFIAGAVSTFIKAAIDGNSEAGDYLEYPSLINLSAETKVDR